MIAVFMLLRAELRGGWRSWLALALLCGVVTGVTLATASVGTRTASAYRRFLDVSKAEDLSVFSLTDLPEDCGRDVVDLEAVSRLREIGVASPYVAWAAGRPDSRFLPFTPISGTDDRFATRIDRPRLLRGRAADQTRPDEAVVSFIAPQLAGLDVGDTVTFTLFAPGQCPQRDVPVGPTVRVRVVGVEAFPGQFPPITDDNRFPYLRLTPAFHAQYQRDALTLDGLAIRLRPGPVAQRTFERHLAPLVQGESFIPRAGPVNGGIDRSIEQQAQVVALLAIQAGLVALVVIVLSLMRHTASATSGAPVLRALGMTPRQLAGLAAVRALVIGSGASAVAVLVGWLGSGLGPIGTARVVEPDPGPSLDVRWTAAIIAASLVAAVLAALAAGRWQLRRAAASVSSGRIPRLLPGLPVAAAVGIRLATDPGRGERAVPVRAALLSGVVAVGAVAVVATVAANLDHLLETSRLYGVNYDVQVGDLLVETPGGDAVEAVRDDSRMTAVARGALVALTINDRVELRGLALAPLRGSVWPSVVDGRVPGAADEIVMGANTMKSIGVGVGDEVSVSIDDTRLKMRVVGQAVFPAIGGGTELGDGAALTAEGLRRFGTDRPLSFGLVALAPGLQTTDLSDAFGGVELLGPLQPGEVVSLNQVSDIPLAMVGVFFALALAMLSHSLVASVRRRRREHAVLGALGFVPGQLVAAVLSECAVLVGVALLIGLPAGVAGGRLLWAVLTGRLGTILDPVIPGAALATLAGGVLLASALVALVPARIAAQVRPAEVLRRE